MRPVDDQRVGEHSFPSRTAMGKQNASQQPIIGMTMHGQSGAVALGLTGRASMALRIFQSQSYFLQKCSTELA